MVDNIENEIWREIDSYPNYKVSNYGRIKSLHYHKTNEECLLKYYTKKVGEYNKVRVSLSKDNVTTKYFVSNIVAKAFQDICGEWFDDCEVHHKDFNPTNNNADNLIILTKEEHKQIHLPYKKAMIGELNPMFGKKMPLEAIQNNSEKLSKHILQYNMNGEFIKEWKNMRVAAKELNCHFSSIGRCLKGKTKSSNGYIWKYAS